MSLEGSQKCPDPRLRLMCGGGALFVLGRHFTVNGCLRIRLRESAAVRGLQPSQMLTTRDEGDPQIADMPFGDLAQFAWRVFWLMLLTVDDVL